MAFDMMEGGSIMVVVDAHSEDNGALQDRGRFLARLIGRWL